MDLDPALQALFDRVTFDHISDVGVERFRALYLERAALAPSPVVIADVSDRTICGGLGARIYRPDPGATGAAVVVLFHGGGWTIGNLDTHDHLAREIARQTDAVVVSVDYRLAPEHPYPAAVEDAWSALQWVAEHAAELGGDPARLAVAGDSAGGNLAAVVAQMARDHGGPALRFQLLWYPATSLDPDLPSMTDNAEAPILNRADMLLFQHCYTGDSDPSSFPAGVVPARGDLTGLPPAYIATAGFDPLRDDGALYAELLQAGGGDVELRLHDGLTHGFIGYAQWVPSAAAALARSLSALEIGLARAGDAGSPRPPDAVPPPLDDDEDVFDAEIVETTTPGSSPAISIGSSPAVSPAPDYSAAGVPSLDYVRDRIEGRLATATGSAELAEAAAAREAASKAAAEHRAAITADQQREAREQAARDRLAEIRRSLE
jgi:acetyl esterase